MALRGAYWAMHRGADAVLLPYGVTADQFVLLSLLAEKDGVSQQELVCRASSDANTVRAMLLLLESHGLVLRRAHPTDRRARSVVLSSRGRRIYKRIRAASEPFRRLLLAAAGRDHVQRLISDLKRISQAMAMAPVQGRRDPSASCRMGTSIRSDPECTSSRKGARIQKGRQR